MRTMNTESLGFRCIQFIDGGLTMPFLHTLNFPSGNKKKYRTAYKNIARSNPSVAVQQPCSILVHTDKGGNVTDSNKISGSCTSNSLLGRVDTVGIIGGVSVFSTLIFLEKVVWWSSRHGNGECFPFIVCSDPALNREIPYHNNSLPSLMMKSSKIRTHIDPVVENLRRKREFLEQSGAHCVVMPCHLSHAWHDQISEGSSVPFLHIGECVAKEIREANLKPLEAGSSVRIGVLATSATLKAGFYQQKLQNQGFEVVLPDKSTMEHIVNPAIKALNKKDMEGSRNLLRIAIQVLLVKAVNTVILASDEMCGILPRADPLLKKCIDPVDALARSTIKWAHSAKKLHE